jgi:uncharacterized repeat protein (TIGR01451 family)
MNLFPFLPFGHRRLLKCAARTRSAREKTRKKLRLETEILEDRCTPNCVTISGFVFHDVNNDGIYEPQLGETPIANSHVELRNAAGAPVGVATTSANGYYQFNQDMTIITAPQTLTRTAVFSSTPTNFTLQQAVAQFDPSLGALQSIDISNQGSVTSRIGVENTSTSSASHITATVSGTLDLTGAGLNVVVTPSEEAGVFDATRFDGIDDKGGTSGRTFGPATATNSATITLTGAAMAPFIGTGAVTLTESAQATSTATGTGGNLEVSTTNAASAAVIVTYHYLLNTCIRPGNYTIVQTPPVPGYLDGKESSNGVVILHPPAPDTIPITVTGAGDLPNNDFGKLLPSSLSGYVYFDTSPNGYNDGIKEPGEPGIAGVNAYLFGANDLGPVGNTYAVTDANGYYSFNNLRPGGYAIAEIQPVGTIHGKDTVGSLGGQSSPHLLYWIGVPDNAQGVNYDFGELLPVISPPNTADLAITKTADQNQVLVGGALHYTLMVSNLGFDTANAVTVQDRLPAGSALYGAAGAGWSFNVAGNTLNATLPSLAAGASSVITVSIFATLVPGTMVNTATVSSLTPDNNLLNNTASVMTPVIAPPAVPFPPSMFPPPNVIVSKAQLVGSGGSMANLDPGLVAQLTYVEGLYRTLFGRPSDAGGLIHFVQELYAGATRSQVVYQFWVSPEHRGQEVDYYFMVFYHRAPTAAERTAYINLFNAGYREEDVQFLLVTSAEYTANHPDVYSFVNGLYLDALGRPATIVEELYWQNYIAGHGRAAAAGLILESDESYGHQIDLAYVAWLHRPSTAAERAAWVAQIRGSLIGIGGVYRSLLASPEFYNLAVQAA